MNLNVKVINPNKKSQSQTFVLRSISSAISTPMQLKEEILKQFCSELVPDDLEFPVGYTKGGSKVWIRMASDVQDVWSFVHSNESVALWCHGIAATGTTGGKRQKHFISESDSDSDDPKSKKKRKKKKSLCFGGEKQ